MFSANRLLVMGISLYFLILSLAFSPAESRAETVVVNRPSVNLRGGPGTGYALMGQVSQGTRLTVVGKSGKWYQVRLSSGRVVWIAGWLVQAVTGSQGTPSRSEETPAAVVVNRPSVNLRGGPGTGYALMGQVSQGTRLTVVGKSGKWYQVRLSSGRVVWIAGWLVQAAAAAPAEAPADSGSGNPAPQDTLPVTTEPVSPSGPEQTPVSRGESGELISVDVKKDNGVTEMTFGFARAVDTSVYLSPEQTYLYIDITGLPTGELPAEQSIDSAVVSQVYSEWLENTSTARIVLGLKAAEGLNWQEFTSADKTLLRLRMAFGPLYEVTGKIIVLDPGHGGSDTGAIGPTGLLEKDFNLDVARYAAEELRRRGAQVFLTREEDKYVDLYARTAKAKEWGATVFVSIHGNASGNPREAQDKAGTSTWYTTTNTPNQIHNSRLLSQCLQKSLVENIGRKDLGLYTANFAVLRTAAMPAALIEAAFVSNPEEEGLMFTDWFRQATARGIVEGLERYFKQA
ncbi:MAG: N-acetylmuramoyl-L-alanine amidase [Bacillota bacterium]